MSLFKFNRQVRDTATEMVDQEVQKFNEASGGALVMGNASVIGDYVEQASWAAIANLAARRNANADKELTAMELSQLLARSIKIDGRIGPVKMTDTQYRRIGVAPEEVAAVVSAQAAEAIIRDQLNTSVMAAKAAIGTVADLKHVAATTAGVPLTLAELNRGNAKLGDRSGLITAYMMHSIAFHELVGEALQNDQRLYTIGDIGVFDMGLGRRYVVSDIPSLIEGSLVHTLGLVVGGVAVQASGLTSFVTNEITGRENIQRQMQGEYEFVVGIKGFQWAKTDVSSPTDAMIATEGNWKQVASSHKDCAGVLITTGKTAASK